MKKTKEKHVYEGCSTVDAFLAKDVKPENVPGGVELRRGKQSVFIPTDRPPRPGDKVVAGVPLALLLDSAFVGEVRTGGGAFNAARGLAESLGPGGRASISLLDTGIGTPALASCCESLGIERVSIGLRASPVSLIAAFGNDKLIIKEPVPKSPACLEPGVVAGIHAAAEEAIVASVSSKDPPVAASLLSAAGARARYLQPTGSLGQSATFALLEEVEAFACNFDELLRLGAWAGIDLTHATENDPEAPAHAARILEALHESGLAAREAAVCTLGRRGSVVADWSTGRMCSVALDLPPGNRGVPTPAGAGDVFFSSWVFLREAGKRIGVRRGREIDAVLGASYAVADRLGVVGAEFRVREESGLRQRASAVAAF